MSRIIATPGAPARYGQIMSTAAPTRACDRCTACCTVMAIPALKKPARVACPHLRRGRPGCGCHTDKPDVCAAFFCGWLDGLGRVEDRPDKSGVIFTASDFLAVLPQGAADLPRALLVVREIRPEATQQPHIADLITAQTEAVVLVLDERDQVIDLRLPPELESRRAEVHTLLGMG